MKKLFAFVVVVLVPVWTAAAGGSRWVLKESTLTYTAYHTLHNTEGVSREAKGKGVCADGTCEFLVAAEVKSFKSGDNNRDLHMLQAVRGADFPLVSVKTSMPESSMKGEFSADLTVNFGGEEVVYPGVKFNVVEKGPDVFHVSGTIPLELVKHKVQRPSLLGMKVKNEAPVAVDVVWRTP